MYKAKAYSAASATSSLTSTTIARRDPAEHDVQLDILFCGICHSDLHQVRNEWSGAMPIVYPCVPGHEIVGRVTKVGSAVRTFKPGDLAAVGCMVDSDRTCSECQAGLEQFCRNVTLTYNFPDKHLGGVTRQAMNNLVSGKAGISAEMAIRLEKAFGGGAETWLRMQAAYDLAQAEKHTRKIKVQRVKDVLTLA